MRIFDDNSVFTINIGASWEKEIDDNNNNDNSTDNYNNNDNDNDNGGAIMVGSEFTRNFGGEL